MLKPEACVYRITITSIEVMVVPDKTWNIMLIDIY